MRVTLKRVAEHAGVSVTTASFVLNNSKQARAITEATKHRVLASARELGYRPHQHAQALRTQRAKTVGILAGHRIDSQLGALIEGIANGCRQHDYRTLLISVSPEDDPVQIATEQFSSAVTDGLIIADRHHEFSRETIQAIAEQIHPVILTGRRLEDPPCPCICDDYRAVGDRGAEHLIGIGRPDILFIGAEGDVTDEFLRGAEDAFRRHGVPWRPDRLLASNYDDYTYIRTHATKVLAAHLEDHPLPGAIFALEHRALYGVTRALVDRQAAIPDQVALLAYGDFDGACSAFRPGISAIQPAPGHMGEKTAALLLEQLSKQAAPAGGNPIITQGTGQVRARASTNYGEPLPPVPSSP